MHNEELYQLPFDNRMGMDILLRDFYEMIETCCLFFIHHSVTIWLGFISSLYIFNFVIIWFGYIKWVHVQRYVDLIYTITELKLCIIALFSSNLYVWYYFWSWNFIITYFFIIVLPLSCAFLFLDILDSIETPQHLVVVDRLRR